MLACTVAFGLVSCGEEPEAESSVVSTDAKAKYTVKHYKQDLSGDGYTFADSEELKGKVGDPTSPTPKKYEGFTAKDFEPTTIAADGTTEVGIYYDRIVREYTVKIYRQTDEREWFFDGVENYEDVTADFSSVIDSLDKTVRYGARINLGSRKDLVPAGGVLDTSKSLYSTTVGTDNDLDMKLYYSFVSEECVWTPQTVDWAPGGTFYGEANSYYYANGRYRTNGEEEYSQFDYVDGMNAFSVELAELNYTTYNSLLRINFRFDGETYTYDKTENVWKDEDGSATDKILMTNVSDGTPADLSAMATDAVGKYVRFMFIGITSDLRIVNDPPLANYDHNDTDAYITIRHRSAKWYSLSADLLGGI